VVDPRPSDTTIIAPLPRPAVAGPKPTVRSIPIPQPPFEPENADDAQDAVSTPEQPEAEQLPVQTAAEERPVQTAASPRSAATVAFTLTVSTGERIAVVGTGLLGRRPIAQPGETPEQLVSVADTGRSVSKTHLEFGIDAGEFWICDRYSANGTVIVPVDGEPRVCEPGRRYRVPRGARVEIGDQHIDVS